MPVQNASQIKEKIVTILSMKGPTIPVHIAKEIGMSMLFTSAFLSELLSDRKIKMSHMRVGNSPVYFVSGQEHQLERFSNYLRSKEKDAFSLLQEKKFLKDSEQNPPIRVALREIKDFAFSFRNNGELYWRYLTVPESEFTSSKIKPIEEHKYIEAKPKVFDRTERQIGNKIIEDIKVEEVKIVKEIEENKKEQKEPEMVVIKEELIIESIPQEKKKEIKEELETEKTKKAKEEKPKKQKQIKVSKKKAPQKKDNEFFDRIKEFLSKETIEILNIESFNKNEILLRIKSEGKEKLLVAYNKKKITDKDIINANKKAAHLNLKYTVLSMGEPSKKLSSLIESAQNLEKMEKIEK
jgi:hypothetical protein